MDRLQTPAVGLTLNVSLMSAIYQYRITKFNPVNRNKAGRYLADEWYLYAQVGETFGGILLTEDEYFRVESAYIATVMDFHREAGLPEIFAIGVEDPQGKGAPAEGSLITADRLPLLCRAMLRVDYWCKIEGDGFFIHFGWDYYMYVGASIPCPVSLSHAESRGLFPEPFISPYHPDDNDS